MSLKELTGKLKAKGDEISQIYTEAGEDMDMSKVKCIEGDSMAKVEYLKRLDAEVSDLKKQRNDLMELDKGRANAAELNREMNTPAQEIRFPDAGPQAVAKKSFGEMFVEHENYGKKHVPVKLDIDMKTLFQTSAGWDPEATRIDRTALYPLRSLHVVDFIPQGTTDKDTIKYMKESTFTNNSAEVAAGGTFGEAALVYTETSDEVEKIAVWLPVTDEQIEDVSGMATFLNGRLTYMIENRLDGQVAEGSGSTPNLLGTLNLSSIQTQALSSDSKPDAMYKAFTKVRSVGFAEPSVLLINPNDWQDIRLATTADGIYLFGSPSDAGTDRIWGVPVLQTTAITANTAICGDFTNYSTLFMRRGIEIQITNAHDDYFIKGKQAIRADLRCSMVHFRDEAFCKVTGI